MKMPRIMKYRFSFLFLLSFILVFSILNTSVYAQDPAAPPAAEDEVSAEKGKNTTENQFSKPLPEIPYFSPESFNEKTVNYKKRPYDDDVLAYKVNVPKEWEQIAEKGSSNFVVSEKLFIELNKFFGPPRMEGRSRLEISAVQIDYDFTAEQWYTKYILESGYTLEGMKVHSDRKVESLMVVMEGDFSYYVRTLAIINGKKVILVQYYLPAAYWQEEAPMQASVLQSFDLINNKVEKIGEYKKYQFLDVADLEYPSSWYPIAPSMTSVERLSARFLNLKEGAIDGDDASKYRVSELSGLSEGHVDITIVLNSVNPSLIAEVENYKKELETSGIVVGKKIDIDPKFTFSPNLLFSVAEVYEAVDSRTDYISYELWFSLLAVGNYYYFVTLLTPSAKQNYVAWARNIRGYRHIVNTFNPSTGAFLER